MGSAELRGTRGPAAPPLLSGRLGRRSGGAKLAKTRRRCFGAAGLAKEQRPPRQGLSPASLNRSRSLCAKAATAASRRAAPAPARAQVRRCCRPQGSSRGARAPPETTAAPPGRGAGSPLAAPPALFGHGAFRSRRRPAATLRAPGDNPPWRRGSPRAVTLGGSPRRRRGASGLTPRAVRARASPAPPGSSRPPSRHAAGTGRAGAGGGAAVVAAAAAARPGPQKGQAASGAARARRAAAPVARSGRGGEGRAGPGRAAPGARGGEEPGGGGDEPRSARPRPEGTWPRRRRRYLGQSRRDARSPPGSPLRSAPTSRYGRAGSAAPPPLPLPAAPTARLQVPGWESRGPGSGGGGSRGAEPSRGGLPSPNSAAPAAPAGPPRRRRPRVPPRRAVREGRVRRRVPPSPAPGAEARGGPGARRHRGSVSAPRRAPPLLRPAGSWRQATGRLLAPLGMSAAAAVRASHVYCR